MPSLYPLRFTPIFRRYLWGGRRLQSVLGKPIGAGDDYAESWEIVDHGADQSIVAFGKLAGASLGELRRTRCRELLGEENADRFPLLFKFLDARRKLSVQVHPNDVQAAKLVPPDFGKTEAWVVLAAEAGACVYAGLAVGTTQSAFAAALQAGRGEQFLHRVEVQVGDCFFIPAGACHAIGAGLLMAEIQQSSDTTYRLFDWNRLGPDGQPRELHIEQGLDAIDFSRGPIAPQTPAPTPRPHVARLVDCHKFTLDRWTFTGAAPLGGDARFHLLAVLSGEVIVENDPAPQPLRTGDSLLLPASSPMTKLTALQPTVLLDIFR